MKKIKIKEEQKYIGKLILSFALFFSLSLLLVLVVRMCGINLNFDNDKHLVFVDFTVSFILVIILGFLYKDILKEGILKVKEMGFKKFIQKVFIAFLIMFFLKGIAAYIVSSILTLIGLDGAAESNNQVLLEQLMGSAPAMMIISVALFAPIEEEILFRGSIGKVIKNKRVFIAVSGLIFGLMHVTGSLTLLIEILVYGFIVSSIYEKDGISLDIKKKLSVTVLVPILIIFGIIYYFQYGNIIYIIMNADVEEVLGSLIYISMGICLAYIYAKEDNIYINMGVHALNNILSVIVILFLA